MPSMGELVKVMWGDRLIQVCPAGPPDLRGVLPALPSKTRIAASRPASPVQLLGVLSNMPPTEPTEADRPVDNAPYLSYRHAGLTIEGYSRAAVQSYWRVPELKLGFDLGAQPWDFMSTPTWLVTHTHLDHVAALPVYVARRRMMHMEPPVLYVPAEAVEDVRRLLLVMQRLDRGRMVCQLNGLNPGDEIELSRENVVTVFGTTHTIPSVGYIVWDRRNKLKEEY